MTISGFILASPVVLKPRLNFLQQPTRCEIRAAAHRSKPDVAAVQGVFDLDAFETLLKQSQKKLCAEIEAIDRIEEFSTDPWELPSGKGVTRGMHAPTFKYPHCSFACLSIDKQCFVTNLNI